MRRIIDAVHFRFLAVLLFGAVLVAASPAQATLTTSEVPIDYLGQAASIGFYTPFGIAIDGTNHWLFVADSLNNRVLVFTLTAGNAISSKTPTYVLGQPDFNSNQPNQLSATPGQNTLYFPTDVAVDPTGQRLFVADDANNRVMVFSTASMSNGMNAANVLGQADFTSNAANTTQSTLNDPEGIAYDGTNNRLFVAESSNNRVTVFSTASITNGMNAANELGQPSGTAFTSNNAATTQSGMAGVDGVTFDSANNRLFAADYTNNRVLVFNTTTITNGMNAANELGQPSGTAFTSSSASVSQSRISGPERMAMDSTNKRLFVADDANNRVLVFNTTTITNGMNAANVLGQTNFTNFNYAASQAGMGNPGGVAYDSTNNKVYVADTSSNRVTVYSTASITNGENASDLLGQYTSDTSTTTITYTGNGNNNVGTAMSLTYPSGVALDAVNHHLFVADYFNSRVLVYNLNTDNSISSHTAANVIGEPDFHSVAGGTTQSLLGAPAGLAFDSTNTRLFVADSSNHRVMIFNTSTITNGMNAANVLGQADFISNGTATAQSGMNNVEAVAYDGVNNRLFVADANNRVLVFNTTTITNGMNAANELGQPSGTAFTSNAPATTQSGMNSPNGLAYDPVNNRLFVTEYYNNRVTVFNTSSITNGMNASKVLGQADFTSGGGATTQSGMSNPVGLSYDANYSRLFVADQGNNRVTVFNVGPSVIANGANATNVLGEPDFGSSTTSNLPIQPSRMYVLGNASIPCVFYDAGSSHLYASDSGDNRVMIFEASFMGYSKWTPGYE